MHILGLHAENIKRIKVVDITPDGHVMQITGKNGHGKTSLLDAIQWGLEGKERDQTRPIHGAEKKGKIHLDLGVDGKVEFIVTRTFSRRVDPDTGAELDPSTSLTVSSPDGAKFPSPQTLMNRMIGALTMDPLEFLRKPPGEQLIALRGFVPDYDFDAQDRLNKRDFDLRTDLNREAKMLRNQAEGIVVPENVPAERVDIADLLKRVDDIASDNERLAALRKERDELESMIQSGLAAADERVAEAERLRALADQYEEEAVNLRAAAASRRAELEAAPPLPDPIDPSPVRALIASAETLNAAFQASERRKSLEAEAAKKQAEADALTTAMDDRKTAAREIIAASDMPVPGIEFGEDCVLLNGVPFSQASDAEQLRTSIAIAMAGNPKLRVMRVREGDKLDDDGLKILADMAEQHDFQVWVEMVRGAGPSAIVFEDGMVKAPALAAAE